MTSPSISIYTEKLPLNWQWTPVNPPPSGTVEFYINTAEQLVKKGYQVSVFYDGEATELNGVYYLPRELYEPTDINIHCNDRAKLGTRNIYWTNKVGQLSKDYMDYDARITLSKYHKSIFGDSIIIGHGVSNKYKPMEKENICLYSSSPDGLWKLDKFPFAKYDYRFVQTYNKSIDEDEMIELYGKARFWLHPGERTELFCLSAIKAQVSGCIPVVVPSQALAETVKTGIRTNLKDYFSELKKALKNPPKVEDYKAESWEEVTDKLIELF